jgi:hypothetical protein
LLLLWLLFTNDAVTAIVIAAVKKVMLLKLLL